MFKWQQDPVLHVIKREAFFLLIPRSSLLTVVGEKRINVNAF